MKHDGVPVDGTPGSIGKFVDVYERAQFLPLGQDESEPALIVPVFNNSAVLHRQFSNGQSRKARNSTSQKNTRQAVSGMFAGESRKNRVGQIDAD